MLHDESALGHRSSFTWSNVYTNKRHFAPYIRLSLTDRQKHDCLCKDKSSPYSITERRVPELIPVIGSQPAGDVIVINPAVGCYYFLPGPQLRTPATLKRVATNFAAW